MGGVVVADRALPGDGLDQRDAVPLGEGRHLRLGQGVAHPAARDQKRPLGPLENVRCLGQTHPVGSGARHVVDDRVEEGSRVFDGDLLYVLRQGDEGRTAIGRVEHGGDCLRQRRDDLLGMGDAVPVADDGLEGVVHRDCRIVELLGLLQHRVRSAVGEGVARQQQHREPISERRGRRGDHVERAGADGCRRHHDLPPTLGLGEADGRQCHRLLVLAAPGRKAVLDRLEGF